MTLRARPWLVALLAAAAAGAALLAATTPWPGRLLFLVIAAGAAVEAVRGAVPAVVADDEGVSVVAGLTRERLRWDDVTAVRALEPPTAGARPRRRANALEIDAVERLVVVPGYRLGMPVSEAVDGLRALSTKNPAGGAGGF